MLNPWQGAVEHFQAFTRHKIGGRAKAMVVTGSRMEAVRYKRSFDRYIKLKGYPNGHSRPSLERFKTTRH
jgi:hypothetical protein